MNQKLKILLLGIPGYCIPVVLLTLTALKLCGPTIQSFIMVCVLNFILYTIIRNACVKAWPKS